MRKEQQGEREEGEEERGKGKGKGEEEKRRKRKEEDKERKKPYVYCTKVMLITNQLHIAQPQLKPRERGGGSHHLPSQREYVCC